MVADHPGLDSRRKASTYAAAIGMTEILKLTLRSLQLPARLSEQDSADEIVLQCKSGMRSAKALHLLQEAGFGKLANLEGGILAWSEQVDPSVPRY